MIQLIEEFDLIDENWINTKKKKYDHFGEKFLIENVCNETFNYFKGNFNVFVCNKSSVKNIRINVTSNSVQVFEFKTTHAILTVFVFRIGNITFNEKFSAYKAYGSFRISRERQLICLDFDFDSS